MSRGMKRGMRRVRSIAAIRTAIRTAIARWSRSRSRMIIAVGGGLGIVGLVIFIGVFIALFLRPLDFGKQVWRIAPGDTLSDVGAQLVARDVVDNALPLRVLARMRGISRQVRAGEYQIPQRASLWTFLSHITGGKGLIDIKVTILEGWTFAQMRAHLRNAPKLKQVAGVMDDAELMAALGHPDMHPEGRFYPDTYHYTAGQTDMSIYRKAFDLMQQKLDFAWAHRAKDLPIADKDAALVLASIIVKESWIPEEQFKIAGVFHNRMNRGMRLQTDPTVIYGLGDAFDGNLTRAHLKTDTPYNTYTRGGLPPTPISLPDETSLQAAVNPAPTVDYYFVATGDGRHQFSETLEQHNAAVRAYLRRLNIEK